MSAFPTICIIIALIIFAFIISVIFPILYIKFGWFKKIYHDILHWHEPDQSIIYKGLNTHSKCKYCGKHIMQDSQGNWFEW